MKHYFASILLLLMAVPFAAQTRQPTLQRSTQNHETNQEQMKPYEGRRISSLEFRGNQHFSSDTLRDFIRTKQGESYCAEKLEDDIDRLRVLLLSRHGYLQPTFGTLEVEDTDSGLKIVVPVQEGILYRWGSIKVEKSTVFSPEEIIKIFGLQSGEIADGYGLQLGFGKLDRSYRDRGYTQLNPGFIPDFKDNSADAEEGVVDITFELEEGSMFHINTIRFEGNAKTPEQTLRRQLEIHEGDIYNDSLLRRSLSRLNALGLFEELTAESLSIRSDDYSKKLDITIHLKEKARE